MCKKCEKKPRQIGFESSMSEERRIYSKELEKRAEIQEERRIYFKELEKCAEIQEESLRRKLLLWRSFAVDVVDIMGKTLLNAKTESHPPKI